jgi:3-methyladenine DNA glycosylase/8-oxoguanine DNA glycosylase
VLLRFPDPFSFELTTERFRAWGPDLANLWHEGAVYRVFEGREVRITAAPGGVEVEPGAPEEAAAAYLGAAFDLEGFYAFAADEPVLAPIVARLAGFRPPVVPDGFESLVTSITAQQVSLFAAFAIRNRLIERFGVRHEHAWSFPTQEALETAEPEELVELGFSRRKAEYVIGVAQARLDYGRLAELPDEQVKARLVQVRGLGEWTADWFLARHLARPRAWPAGDLGLRKALALHYAGGVDPARFAPFENLTAHYLLLSLRFP